MSRRPLAAALRSADREVSDEAMLAEGFAQHCLQWASHEGRLIDAGSQQTLKQAARMLSLASSAGHVCLPLSALLAPTSGEGPAITIESLRNLLRVSGIVGTPAQPGAMPLILDDQDRLYLHRYFDYERRLAQRLHRACAPVDPQWAPPESPNTPIQWPLAGMPDPSNHTAGAPGSSAPDRQQLAVALAMLRRLCIISGGPGTGKTTTVVALLACLLEQAPHARIALAAPTGKAAARLLQTLQARASALPETIRARLPNTSFTVHRLLGAQGDAREFRHHTDNPLPLDLLIVDEASMLDLALATRLLEAMPDAARIVLLGDKDQLASVEAGAVFAQISQSPTFSVPTRAALARWCQVSTAAIAESLHDALHEALHEAPHEPNPPAQSPDSSAQGPEGPAPAGALSDSVIWLNRPYRFDADSPIAQAARQVREASADALIDTLRACTQGPPPAALHWVEEDVTTAAALTPDPFLAGYADFARMLRLAQPDGAECLAVFNRFRILCAVREGPRGSHALNRRVSDWLRLEVGASAAAPTFKGQAIIVRRNDPLLRLFNGDIGLMLPGPGGRLLAWFGDESSAPRAIDPARLPRHEEAFALTIHASQGSEFNRVAVVLPQQASRVVSRELLYTAITRAREQVLLHAPESVLRAAVNAPTRRDSGLVDRLREVALRP